MTPIKDLLSYSSGDLTSDRNCLETRESVEYSYLGRRVKMSKMASLGNDVIRDVGSGGCSSSLLVLEVISRERGRLRPQKP